MKRFIPFLMFIAIFTALGFYTAAPPVAATCTGSANYKACKNCKYCKHCKKDGGTCGICK